MLHLCAKVADERLHRRRRQVELGGDIYLEAPHGDRVKTHRNYCGGFDFGPVYRSTIPSDFALSPENRMAASTRVASLKKYFSPLKDPRVRNRTKQRLIDIVAIALCGVIANCDTWAEIVDFGTTHAEWLKRFLKLPGGIPSQDTFERVFAKINPAARKSRSDSSARFQLL